MYEKKQYINLTQYVESLLRMGKRSKDEDFQVLFKVYGEEKITELARQILKQIKETKKNESGN